MIAVRFFACSYIWSYNGWNGMRPRTAQTSGNMAWILSMRKRCFAASLSQALAREKHTEKSAGFGIGSIRGRTAYVVFTEHSPDTIRIISLRKATRREDKQYQKAIQNGLEAG